MRKRREFGAPVYFSDRNVADAKDGLVECPSYEDENYSLEKKELDKAVQVFQHSLPDGRNKGTYSLEYI